MRVSSLNCVNRRVCDVSSVCAPWLVGVWAVFDCTEQGLAMAVLTAVAGPVAEIFLINVLHLYHYNNPDFLGIPSWITWVYFCGSPAVVGLGAGGLARFVLFSRTKKEKKRKKR